MNLYDRDYQRLTDDEDAARIASEQKCNGKLRLVSDFYDVPKAVTHYRTLFPNNYLDPSDLTEDYVREAVAEFRQLLEQPEVSERQVLNFIRDRRFYFLIGSLLRTHTYGFGHHAAYLFAEFRLGNNFAADFVLVGRGSNGHEFVFVELESPQKSTVKEGALGGPFRKGIEQVERWKHWLEENFPALRLTFEKSKTLREELPREFHVLDSSRLHFVVIAGRRENFNDFTYRLARNARGNGSPRIMHYDHLLDHGAQMAGIVTY